jgi:hypothetical protein
MKISLIMLVIARLVSCFVILYFLSRITIYYLPSRIH